MYQQFFTDHGVLLLPILAMLLFAVTFLSVSLGAMRRSRRSAYGELAHLPLAADATEVHHG